MVYISSTCRIWVYDENCMCLWDFKKMARMLYLSRRYLNILHFKRQQGGRSYPTMGSGRSYPTMGNECVFTIVQWDFWKETFFKTSLVNLYICWKMKYIQKVFEYVRDLVLLCWKALIPKKVAWKIGRFYKNYNIW